MARVYDSKNKNDWSAGGVIRRDFRHSHDGPEEMPHKRRGRGKKFCKRSDSGKHSFTETRYKTVTEGYVDPETGKRKYRYKEAPYKVCAYCGKPAGYLNYWGQFWNWRNLPEE